MTKEQIQVMRDALYAWKSVCSAYHWESNHMAQFVELEKLIHQQQAIWLYKTHPEMFSGCQLQHCEPCGKGVYAK